jgi:Haem-dependent oxidative N-demethylase, alpha subunit-like
VELDPTTGLPVAIAAYAPDAAVYEAMLDESGPPGWLDELELRPAPPFHRVGTHAVGEDGWLVADRARTMELDLRSRLLDERRDTVVACRPNAERAAAATLDLVIEWLGAHGVAHGPVDDAEHPLVAIGRLIQEDVCLMVHRDGDWHLDAGVLCFPTLWELEDRLGLPTWRVHERVAHYGEIRPRVDTFFDRLRPDRIVWRRNLSIKPYPHLHLPVQKVHAPTRPVDVSADGSPFWIRSERQTLRRLADHEAIVFTIKIQTVPARALLDRPDIARALADHLASWDDAIRDYKFSDPSVMRAFMRWLDTVGT